MNPLSGVPLSSFALLGTGKIVITEIKQLPQKMGFTMEAGRYNFVLSCCTLPLALSNGK